jgi:hypothetical protein
MIKGSKLVRVGAAAVAVVVAASCDSGGGAAPSCVPGTVIAGPHATTGLSFDAIELGTTRVYRVTSATGVVSTQTYRVTARSATHFTRTYETAGNTTVNVFDISGGGELTESSGSLIYSPPYVLLPADVTTGATAHTVSDFSLNGLTYSTTRDATVGDVECVATPAGNFPALKVTTLITNTSSSGDVTNVAWWASGVGRVKIVNYPTATPASTTTWELTSLTGSAPQGSTLDGTYTTTAIRCAGTSAPSPIADLIAAPHSMRFAVSGTSGSISWSDGTCTIVQPVAYAFPSAGNLTLSVAGAFSCTGTCSTLSTETFGVYVCGFTDQNPPRSFTFTPTSVAVGGAVTLTRVGGAECAVASATDPISYVLTRQ